MENSKGDWPPLAVMEIEPLTMPQVVGGVEIAEEIAGAKGAETETGAAVTVQPPFELRTETVYEPADKPEKTLPDCQDKPPLMLNCKGATPPLAEIVTLPFAEPQSETGVAETLEMLGAGGFAKTAVAAEVQVVPTTRTTTL